MYRLESLKNTHEIYLGKVINGITLTENKLLKVSLVVQGVS